MRDLIKLWSAGVDDTPDEEAPVGVSAGFSSGTLRCRLLDLARSASPLRIDGDGLLLLPSFMGPFLDFDDAS